MNIIKRLLFILVLLKTYLCYSQVPSKSEQYVVSKNGFVYYTNKDYLVFVAPKNENQSLDYKGFFNDSLGLAYYLPAREGLPSLLLSKIKKCEKRFKLLKPWMNQDSISIIPVKISFIVYAYDYKEATMKGMIMKENYELEDKTVKITSIGFLSMKVNSLTPACN